MSAFAGDESVDTSRQRIEHSYQAVLDSYPTLIAGHPEVFP